MLSRTLKLSTAALAAAVMATVMAAPAGANYTKGVDVDLSIVNHSPHAISAAFCPRGHVSISYQFGTREDPCNVTPYIHHLSAGDRYGGYKANPIGIVVRGHNRKTLYFYVRNPSLGKPFFEVNGHKYTMVEGELRHIHVAGANIELHRQGDRDKHKIMIIVIKHMAAA